MKESTYTFAKQTFNFQVTHYNRTLSYEKEFEYKILSKKASNYTFAKQLPNFQVTHYNNTPSYEKEKFEYKEGPCASGSPSLCPHGKCACQDEVLSEGSDSNDPVADYPRGFAYTGKIVGVQIELK